MPTPSFKDIELLTAYMDMQLDAEQIRRLDLRLMNDPELADALKALNESRGLLRKLPQRRAPKNFTLTYKMAGLKAPLPRAYPTFRLASAFASLLFIITLATNFVSGRIAMQQYQNMVSASDFGTGGGGGPETRPQSGGGCGEESGICPTLSAELFSSAPATEAPTEAPMALAAVATDEPSADSARNTGEMQDDPSAKAQPAPTFTPPISQTWQMIILFFAILAGAFALALRWNTDRNFEKKKHK